MDGTIDEHGILERLDELEERMDDAEEMLADLLTWRAKNADK